MGQGKKFKIGISGVHGTGKTTLCYELAAILRRSHVNVAVVPETVRESIYLNSRLYVPEMEIEILGLQLSAETRMGANCDTLICDRTAFDTAAYTLVRFPNRQDHPCVKSIVEFSRHYSATYDVMLYLDTPACSGPSGDAFRDHDNVASRIIAETFESLIKVWSLQVHRVDWKTPIEEVVEITHARST